MSKKVPGDTFLVCLTLDIGGFPGRTIFRLSNFDCAAITLPHTTFVIRFAGRRRAFSLRPMLAVRRGATLRARLFTLTIKTIRNYCDDYPACIPFIPPYCFNILILTSIDAFALFIRFRFG